MPTGLELHTATVTFVVLVTDTGGNFLNQFLKDHMPLLGLLPQWRIVAVLPGHVAGLQACETVFNRLRTTPARTRSAAEKDDLRLAFTVSLPR